MNRLIPTRWSHLLGYSGVGAIVRAENDLFVIMDIRHWTDRATLPAGELIPYVDLLRDTLEIDRKRNLRAPPLARELPKGAVDGTCVPAIRFPAWTRCPRCGLLHWRPWRHGDEEPGIVAARPPCCQCDGHPRLQQVAWVLAHPQGGLADLPWHWLSHRENSQRGRECRADSERAYLRLQREGNAGIDWRLHCDRCGAGATFDRKLLLRLDDPVRQPWVHSGASAQKTIDTDAVILEVSDPRLYYPRTRSALAIIPPESQVQRGSVLDRLYSNQADRDLLDRSRTDLARRGAMKTLASRYGCPDKEINAAWHEIQMGFPRYGQTATPGELLAKEYQALIQEIPNLRDGADFTPRHRTQGWGALAVPTRDAVGAVLAAVDLLVAVTRLREVRIFTGFSRIKENFDDGLKPTLVKKSADAETKARLVPPDLDGSLDWLPAIELWGEGIFFTLNETMLQRWARQPGLKARTETLGRRFERTGMRFSDATILPLTPRFILLHTLAHLLIRQLETQAGYPAASIRERIYCAEGEQPMAGILVYVAVPDIVGSLGGLAELAEPGRFLRLLTSVFAHADWCSLDPVCSEHEGQGPSQLNLAACHACALVPEPSCQFGNALLDRTFVRGDLAGNILPLLHFAAGRT